MDSQLRALSDLTVTQQAAIAAEGSAFLHGQAGAGKTTALLHRLLRLLQERETPYAILVLVAEADDRPRVQAFLQQHGTSEPRDLAVTTFTYLAREMVQQFWPLVARPAGFERPFQPPTYLRYDMAQLLMWRIVRSMISEGAFADLLLRPQQIVSQILDTLNRAALNRLSLEQAEQRQIQSWAGDPPDARHLREAARAAQAFRAHCRRNSLLDVSLAVRVFDTQLLQHPEFHRYFRERFRHILVDNVEEQTPAGQQFVAGLLDVVLSAAIVYDEGGGYKQLLSADPAGARRLAPLCRQQFRFDEQFVSSPSLVALADVVQRQLLPSAAKAVTDEPRVADEAPSVSPIQISASAVLDVVEGRYRHEMAQNTAQRLGLLLTQHEIAPDDAAIITPGLDGAMRYTLSRALREAGLPFSLLRRRSSPRDEPLVRAWLTWLALAHPDWQRPPPAYDVSEALTLSISGLDPARAELLSGALYRADEGAVASVDELSPELLDRVGDPQVAAVEELREWLAARAHLPPDDFLQNLYTFLSSEPAYRAHGESGAAELSQWLIDLAARLRQASASMGLETAGEMGRAFLNAIDEGLVSADPPEMGEPPQQRGVLVTTIHGYLLSQETSRMQVWFDVSNPSWWDIPRQPLSNPFVLAPDWAEGKVWTLADAYRRRNEILSHVIRGLAVRCRDGVVLALSTLDQAGRRQDSPLWRALNQITTVRP